MSSRIDRARRQRRFIPTVLATFAGVAIVGLPLLTWAASRRRGEAEWVVALRDTVAEVRAVAAFEASRSVAPALLLVNELAKLLADSSADVRREAVAALVRIGRSSRQNGLTVTRVVAAVLSEARNPAEKVEAAQILGAIGGHASSASATLAAALGSSDVALRATAVNALGRTGTQSDLIVHRVADLARDSAPDVRAAAVEALARLRPDGATVALLAPIALYDSSAYVRLAAVYAIAASGGPNDAIVAALEGAVNDRSSEVRRAAARALERRR